jgi:hypothetical protein
VENYGYGEIAFEPGAVLAAVHYFCTYIDRSPFFSFLPRPGEQIEQQQRLSFYLPKLHEQQKALAAEQTTAAHATDGRVNVIFNPYRQVAAVAVPSPSTLFRIHKKSVALKEVLNTQPQVKIVPDFERLSNNATGCPVVSLGRDMHFILVDITAAPNVLLALTGAPGLFKSIDSQISLDEAPGWGAKSLKDGLLAIVWFVRGKRDQVKGEATIENLRCRIFGDVSGWEEEGLGSGAAAVGGWMSLQKDGSESVGDESLAEKVENLRVEDGNDRDAEGGAEITPKQTQDKGRVERKVFGIQTGVEIGRNSTVAVEVDVLVDKEGQRTLGGMVVSGRANFETRGELLGS